MSKSRLKGAQSYWPLSRRLFREILNDRISDSFLAELVWERLGYLNFGQSWQAGPTTPEEWLETFPRAPEVIANRPASVQLTRSIPKEYKQLLKKKMDFAGYSIDELYPRRTRRATAINWLLAWLEVQGARLPEEGPLPPLMEPPLEPNSGHPGDPLVE